MNKVVSHVNFSANSEFKADQDGPNKLPELTRKKTIDSLASDRQSLVIETPSMAPVIQPS
jgi:hypothetical protein